ncbi:MAG: hypothetical protein ACPG4N_07485 [Gammaproteobacteria bacterium]
MQRLTILLLVLIFSGGPALADESQPPVQQDKGFKPSETITAESAVSFPVDI